MSVVSQQKIEALEDIRCRLRLSRVIDNMDDEELMKECIKQIMPSAKQILYSLAKSSKSSEAESMLAIIAKIKMKHKLKRLPSSDNKAQQKGISLVRHSFATLSNDAMCHVVGFLGKKDIKSFKSTSKQSAIICLEEMKKVGIRVLHLHAHSSENAKNFSKYFQNEQSLGSVLRYPRKLPVYQIFEHWSKYYEIPEHHQLVYFRCRYPSLVITQFLNTMNSKWMRAWSAYTLRGRISRNPFLIMDKRNIIIMNQNKARKVRSSEAIHAKNLKLVVVIYTDADKHRHMLPPFACSRNTNNHHLVSFIRKNIEVVMNDIKSVKQNRLHPELLLCDSEGRGIDHSTKTYFRLKLMAGPSISSMSAHFHRELPPDPWNDLHFKGTTSCE